MMIIIVSINPYNEKINRKQRERTNYNFPKELTLKKKKKRHEKFCSIVRTAIS